MSFNKVILVGNLTADVELKQATNGQSVCSFRIAVNRKMAKNNECDFINIVAWRQTAEFICRYFKKGNPILVCGSLQTRTWQDKQGNKRTETEVVVDEATFVANKETTAAPTYNPYVPQPKFEEVPLDESLPF